ncbi:MAG: glucose-6-phosphate isomerase [Pseudomonadales bacterium]|nr:glucose-6-phosphate isomerase [Pseudomonadales bacterium]
MPAWQQLQTARNTLVEQKTTIHQQFESDPLRFDRFSVKTPELVFDYSKNLLTADIQQLLFDLADQCQLPVAIDRMFTGQSINPTERRPALHVALRGHHVNGLEKEVAAVREKMAEFVGAIRGGSWKGCYGDTITDVVNIGIGGSHLGPAMVVRALENFAVGHVRCHFISNVDPAAALRVLSRLKPASTLFIVASKSFSTLETHQNALLARRWFLDNGGAERDLRKHFVAVSSNVEAAAAFGIDEKNIFPMWDWVGGRYSLWSAIGLPIALSVGMDHFRELLTGAHHADEHFRTQPLSDNIPVIMGLLTAWYGGFYNTTSQVVLPYSQSLELFPAFLQQLSMESLGKGVNLAGDAAELDTGQVVWGAPGTDGQHSFHQLLHQGTRIIPADFIAVAASPGSAYREQQDHLLANCFSQSQALMDGKSLDQAVAELKAAGMDDNAARELAPHKVIPGNRPSNTFLLHKLTPHTLGYLTALYEHAVYVQSVLWDINAFDQWGVELGKKLSGPIFSALADPDKQGDFDASTNNLIAICKTWQED